MITKSDRELRKLQKAIENKKIAFENTKKEIDELQLALTLAKRNSVIENFYQHKLASEDDEEADKYILCKYLKEGEDGEVVAISNYFTILHFEDGSGKISCEDDAYIHLYDDCLENEWKKISEKEYNIALQEFKAIASKLWDIKRAVMVEKKKLIK